MGTRILRINLAAIVGLLRWPFPHGTSVTMLDDQLPADTRFVKVIRFEEPSYVHVLLLSAAWDGHSDELLAPPQFKYEVGGAIIAAHPELALVGKEH